MSYFSHHIDPEPHTHLAVMGWDRVIVRDHDDGRVEVILIREDSVGRPGKELTIFSGVVSLAMEP